MPGRISHIQLPMKPNSALIINDYLLPLYTMGTIYHYYITTVQLPRLPRHFTFGSHMLNDANWRHVPCYLMDYNLVSVTI